jgi:hypothetical protein
VKIKIFTVLLLLTAITAFSVLYLRAEVTDTANNLSQSIEVVGVPVIAKIISKAASLETSVNSELPPEKPAKLPVIEEAPETPFRARGEEPQILTDIVVDVNTISKRYSDITNVFSELDGQLFSGIGFAVNQRNVYFLEFEKDSSTKLSVTEYYKTRTAPHFLIVIRNDEQTANSHGYATSFGERGFCNPFHAPTGNPRTYVAVLRDMSEISLARAAIHELLHHFGKLTDSYDHSGTVSCRLRSNDNTNASLFGICGDIIKKLKNSYRAC